MGSRQTIGATAVVAVVMAALWWGAGALVNPPHAPTPGLRAIVERLQTRIRESRELQAEFITTVWYQKVGPIRVQWRKPDFFLIDSSAWGDNGREVYWFRDSGLGIYQDWPKRGEKGVHVTNVVELLEGDKEHAYEVALKRMPNHAGDAGIGLRLLQLVGEAPADKLGIQETEGRLRVSVGLEALGVAAKDFQPTGDVKTTFVFEIPTAERDSQEILRIWMEHEGIPSEAGTSVQFMNIDFQFAPGDGGLPDVPFEVLQPVRLTKLAELEDDLTYEIPFRRKVDRPRP